MSGDEESRSTAGIRRPVWSAVAALPAALTVYLGFHSGGFFPGAASFAAAEMAIAMAVWLVVAKRPAWGFGLPVCVAALALGAFTAWTLASAGWSHSAGRALPEYTRVVLYAMTLVFFGLLPFDAKRIRWMLYSLATAIAVICAFAVVARTLPQTIFDPVLVEKERLGYPLTYWNALGLLAGIGIVLCGHLSCSTREPRPARVLGAAAVPLLTLTLFYTLSRGATWAAIGAVVVYALVGRPRALISGAIATVPTTLVILAVANPPNTLAEGYPAAPAAIAAGRHVALMLVACMLGAAVLRTALLPVDRWVDSFRLPEGSRRPLLAGIAASGFALILASAVALNVPHVVQAKYAQFTSKSDSSPSGGGDRLFSASTNGRKEHWEVAMDAFKHNKLHGSGAGTFTLLWAKGRAGSVHVEDAHSLYIETLGELGLVGFVLLLIVIALILGAFAYRARGPDRAMFAALLAAGLAWAAASGVDWDWEMPATTVWLFAFGGAALARSPGSRRRSWPRGWGAAARILAVVACLAVAVIPARVSIAAGRFGNALDDLKGGNCQSAKVEARSALSVVSQRAAPYTLVAFCDLREGRYRPAVTAARAAQARDPHNWETNYSLAVARAAAGLNPRAAARRAAILNPNDPHAASAPVALGGHDRRAWIAAGRSAVLLPPTADDP